MLKKSRLLLAPLAALSLFAVACGGDDDGGSSASEAPAGTEAAAGGCDLVGGIAFDTGGRGDGTFNDSAAAGGERAAAELGI